MDSFNAVQEVYDTLSESSRLQGRIVTKAYPFLFKPLKLEKSVIAVMPAGVETAPCSIGSDESFGTLKVVADIYTPHKLGLDELNETAKAAVLEVSGLSPSSISVSVIKNDRRLGCIYCRCSFGFSLYLEETEALSG